MLSPYLVAIAVVSCVAAAAAAVFLLRAGGARRTGGLPGVGAGDTVFLFEGADLVDATPLAERLFASIQGDGTDWGRAIDALAPHFPGLRRSLAGLAGGERLTMTSAAIGAELVATVLGERVRLVIRRTGDGVEGGGVDPMIHSALVREAETLRAVAEHLPYLVWQQSETGEIVWANSTYRTTARELLGRESGDDGRLLALFSADAMAQIAREGGVRRQVIDRAGEDETWFECRVVPAPDAMLFAATQINATVQAEQQLREFMQTLTKTFSHLTTGLAIFDRQRRLSLFNPALTDLTGLPVDFLAARPSLYAVLDRLRDRRMIPEPKDYSGWRKRLSDLEAAATDGTFSETWALPDSRTYRVSGRPHPGGALAFVIEDISAEMSLTRRFRSELELGQAVIDAMEDAIVVFSTSGAVSMVNRAYQEFWEDDIAASVDVPTVTEVSRVWMARTKATPVWGEIRDFVSHERERSAWEDRATLVGGRPLRVRVAPLSGGSTLVSFRIEAPVADAAESVPRSA